MKQTAVEWLLAQIKINGFQPKHIKQAKEMEKKQIEDSFIEGSNTIYVIPKTFEEYYNETYGGNNGKN
jgi:hypothetical protein